MGTPCQRRAIARVEKRTRDIIFARQDIERIRALREAVTNGEDIADKALTFFQNQHDTYLARLMRIERPMIDGPLPFGLNEKKIARQKKAHEIWDTEIARERQRVRAERDNIGEEGKQ